MNDEAPKKQATCLGRVFSFSVRLVFVLVVGIVLGAGIFFGSLFLYRQYITIVQDHSWQLYELETRQEQIAQQTSQRLSDYQGRAEDLEVWSDSAEATLDEIDERLNALDELTEAQSSALRELTETQLTQQESLGVLEEEVEGLGADLDSVTDDVSSLGTDMRELATAVAGNSESLENALADLELLIQQSGTLQNELAVMHALELLTRSRIYIVHENYSLARADLLFARELLIELQAEAPDFQVESLEMVIEFIDEAITNLPAEPITALNKLESAWDLLVSDLPEEGGESE